MAPVLAWGSSHASSEASSAAGESRIQELINNIREQVYLRRLRVKEPFVGFDRLRFGRITKHQFARAVKQLYPPLMGPEAHALAEHFTEIGPKVRWPQVVNYTKFCQAIEEVFAPKLWEKRSTPKAPEPQFLGLGPFVPAPVEDEDKMWEMLARIATLAETRGIEIHSCFQDACRSQAASVVYPRGSGKITQQMFLQRFPFTADLDESDVQMLMDRYRTFGDGIQVSALVKDIHALIQERALEREKEKSQTIQQARQRPQSATQLRGSRSSSEFGSAQASPTAQLAIHGSQALRERPAPQRPLSASAVRSEQVAPSAPQRPMSAATQRPEQGVAATLLSRRPVSAVSSRSRRMEKVPHIDALTKVKAIIAERRLRVAGSFNDFDKLRKGVCTASQLKAALTLLGILLDVETFATLFDLYRTESNMFNYRTFVAEVGEQSEPPPSEARSIPATTTLRYKAELTEQQHMELREIQKSIARRVELRGMEIRTVFEDFSSRCGIATAGHVTVSQLARTMAALGFVLTDDQLELLCQAYCDTDDGQGFNYLALLSDIDPGPPLDSARPLPPRERVYFDVRQRVVPRGTRPQSAPLLRRPQSAPSLRPPPRV